MNRFSRIRYLAFPLWLLGLAAWAAGVVPLTTAELAARSELVLEARVVSGEPGWSGAPGASMLFTYWTLQVADPIKGVAPAAFFVRTPGGRMDGRAVRVPGAPTLRPGQEAIFFLVVSGQTRNGVAVYDLLGWEQGVATIDAAAGQARVVQRRVPGRDRAVLISADAFKRELRALAAPPPAGAKP